MKATIDKDGILLIQAETELEAFALSVWAKMNITPTQNFNEINGEKVMASWGLENDRSEGD